MIQPDFDSIKRVDPYGHEFWSARELMPCKSEIANAQVYFAVSTRVLEIEQLRVSQEQRLKVSEVFSI